MKNILAVIFLLASMIECIGQSPVQLRPGDGSTGQYIPTALTSAQILVGNSSNVAQARTASGDATISNTGAFTIVGLNSVLLSGLSTGILKNTTSTGTPSIAVAGTDYLAPFGSQTQNYIYAAPNGSSGSPSFRAMVSGDLPSSIAANTSGSAGSVINALTIPAELSAIGATSFNGSAARTLAIQNLAIVNAMIANGTIDLTAKVTGILPGTNGGTGVNNGVKTLTLSGNTIIGSTTNTVTIGTSGNTSVALPTSGTLATIQNTETFTNKRYVARTGTTTSSATPSINTDNVDIYFITALAVDVNSFSTNLTGTPNQGDVLELVITGTATRNLTWGSAFVNGQAELPAATDGTNTSMVFLQYLTTSFGTAKWHCMSTNVTNP